MSRYYVRNGMHYGTADEMIDRIEQLEREAKTQEVILDIIIKERDATFVLMFNRAETAEAKLARAVEALEGVEGNLTNLQPKIADNLVSKDWLPVFDRYIDLVIGIARTTLAELKGKRS